MPFTHARFCHARQDFGYRLRFQAGYGGRQACWQQGVPSADPGLRPGVCGDRPREHMSAHHAYQMYAHITWHTWKRVACVDRLAAIDVKSAVSRACKETGVHLLREAVLSDHVHLVVSFRPDTRLCDFVRVAKSVAVTRANRRIAGAIRWARGYNVTTLHRSDLDRVVRYVARQFQRHPDRIPGCFRSDSTPGD